MKSAAAAFLLCLMAGQAAAQITSATYADPTDRYPHGVLGTTTTYAALDVTLADGSHQLAGWAPGMVFEDTAPRLVDLDGDGAPEVITVESADTKGARLAVWGLNEAGQLTSRAFTPFLGMRFRWLAVAGAADLDGDGLIEIAYVDRPHLAKVLRILRYRQIDAKTAQLEPVAAVPDLTNHSFGDPQIFGGIRDCDGLPAVVTTSADGLRIMATTLQGGRAVTVNLGPNDAADALSDAMACKR
jgi:hypothetical protein